MSTILAIVIVLNLALLAVLVYRHWLVGELQKTAHAINQDATRICAKAVELFAHAKKTAVLAEKESAHEVCSACGRIVTRYDKDLESGKVTCIDCVSKIAQGAEIKGN